MMDRDRHRGGGGDRYGSNNHHNHHHHHHNNSYNTSSSGNYNDHDSYHNRTSSGSRPSRFSDEPVDRYSDNGNGYSSRRSPPGSYRGGGGRRAFDSPPRHGPPGLGAAVGGRGGGGDAGYGPIGGDVGGVGFPPMGGGSRGGGFVPSFQAPPPLPPPEPLSGQKRGYSQRGGSPDRSGGASFAKLFVGSVPRTITEQEIRPLFEEHGDVVEVALIRDKRTGQPQGCCFIKYATAEEADSAIRALHNQYTLPGGTGPIQVRYADGERERLGAVEYKLFVGSLNKQATEKEVEEIFAPYGRVEDVYIMRDAMKQNRGCAFVKYSHRDMAIKAIKALNGIYTMRGCDQPLTVRFADPKRPKTGDSRTGPALGGPGVGPQFQAPGPRPPPNFADPVGDGLPPNAWHPMSPQKSGASGVQSFGSQFLPRSGDLTMPVNQNFNQPSQQLPPIKQQISPLEKTLQSPQNLPPALQLHPPASYSQTQTSYVNHIRPPQIGGQAPFSQGLPSQHLLGSDGQVSASQPQSQQVSSGAKLHNPLLTKLPSHSQSVPTNQSQLGASAPHQVLHSLQQSPSQLAQMLSQQTQTLQASFQSSQQAFSQLQQQLQMIQPSNQHLPSQQSSQVTKQQWSGIATQTVTPVPPASLPADVPPSTAVMSPTLASVKCSWTEHTSPEGFKYYYNSLTRESRWEKPEELALFEQQHLQQKPSVQQSHIQANPQVLSTQQPLQAQQMQVHAQLQTQFRPHQQPQQPSFSSSYNTPGARVQHDAQDMGYAQQPVAAGSVNDPTRFQGPQATHEWMWKNKPAGSDNFHHFKFCSLFWGAGKIFIVLALLAYDCGVSRFFAKFLQN
ncbi:hypothetical protein Tsubulata_041560, partial [Turnera subulata]